MTSPQGFHPAHEPLKRRSAKAKARTAHNRGVAAVRRAVFERDWYLCRACFVIHAMTLDVKTATDLHEIVFRSQGGKQTMQNCVALCHQHHMQIHARTLWIKGTDANGPLQFVTEKP